MATTAVLAAVAPGPCLHRWPTAPHTHINLPIVKCTMVTFVYETLKYQASRRCLYQVKDRSSWCGPHLTSSSSMLPDPSLRVLLVSSPIASSLHSVISFISAAIPHTLSCAILHWTSNLLKLKFANSTPTGSSLSQRCSETVASAESSWLPVSSPHRFFFTGPIKNYLHTPPQSLAASILLSSSDLIMILFPHCKAKLWKEILSEEKQV